MEKNNNTTYSSLAIANFILKQAQKGFHDLDVLKLNRLLFIAFGRAKSELDRVIFVDRIEAWKYGPIIPSVYHYFSHYHLKPIQGLAFEYDFFENEFRCFSIDKNDSVLKSFLIDVWKQCGDDSKFSLVHHIWSENSPWSKAYRGKEFEEIDKKKLGNISKTRNKHSLISIIFHFSTYTLIGRSTNHFPLSCHFFYDKVNARIFKGIISTLFPFNFLFSSSSTRTSGGVAQLVEH